MREPRAMSRLDREWQIFRYVQYGTALDRRFTTTVYATARAIQLRPSHHLRRILDGMVDKGIFASFDVPCKGFCTFTRHYMLHPRRRVSPQLRHVPIKKNGEVVDVLNFEEEL